MLTPFPFGQHAAGIADAGRLGTETTLFCLAAIHVGADTGRLARGGGSEAAIAFAEEGRAEEGLPDEGFAEEGLAEEGLADEGLPDDGLAEDGLAEDGLAEDGREADLAEDGRPAPDRTLIAPAEHGRGCE